MFNPTAIQTIERLAKEHNFEPAVLQAVVEVESDGVATTVVDGKHEPLIRFEGHYFYRRLKGSKREYARQEGLAHPTAGRVKNPKTQAGRYRLLSRATNIDAVAAFESVSWGVGQVMGAHWKTLEFASPDEMLTMVRTGVAGQVEVMVRYIVKFDLLDELQRKDFTAFARGYNGANYARNAYHTRMAAAYKRLTGETPISAARSMLRMGSKGARVRELQNLLVRAGYSLKIDGDFGVATKDALKAFQVAQKIQVDGVAGPETMRALSEFRVAPEDTPGDLPIKDVPEVKDAITAVIPITTIAAAKDKIIEIADQLIGLDFGMAQTIGNVLMTGAGLIAVGMTAYAIYGVWKSRKTYEGDVFE